jgi:hypothetical protein
VISASIPAPLGAQTLPWYRVIPPFSWVTQPKKPPRLRPAGHSAWVEAMHQPALFLISLAFTSAGLYSLAKDYVIKAFSAIGSGDYGQIVPVCLALFAIVVTGGAIEIAFLTAASRFRMHLLRGRSDFGWTVASAVMLALTISVEGLTCSYMFYLIEQPRLSPSLAAFMQNVPTLLFFVRAFAGLLCGAYLIIGVLPFVVRPDDVRREMAAEAGAAKVAIIQRLLNIINNLSVWQMLAIYEPVAAIFRDNAGYTSQQMSHRMVLDALAQVRGKLNVSLTTLAPQFSIPPQQLLPVLATVFDPVEQYYRERGIGAELEKYDQQTHEALTRLQERLQSTANAQAAQAGGISPEQFAQVEATLTSLQEHIAATPVPSREPEEDLETRFQEWAGRLAQQFSAQVTRLQEQLESLTTAPEERSMPLGNTMATQTGEGGLVSMNEVAPQAVQDVRHAPKPGTKKFQQLVYTTALQLLGDERLTIFNISQTLQHDPKAVQDAITALKQDRLRHLKPGQELEFDPVLDVL